jgi:hypothetical protein
MKLYTKLAVLTATLFPSSYMLAVAAAANPVLAPWYVGMSMFTGLGALLASIGTVAVYIDTEHRYD